MSSFYNILINGNFEIEYVKINKYIEINIQKYVVNILGVADLGKLRDKYEGQAFLDDKVDKIFSYLAVCDFFGIKRPSIDLQFVTNIKSVIEHNSYKYVIHSFDIESLPVFEVKEYLVPRILVMRQHKYTYGIIGIVPTDILNDEKRFKQTKSVRGKILELHDFSFLNNS